MPQFSSLHLKAQDGTAVDFVPRDINNGVGVLTASTGIPIADKRITLSLPRTANGKTKFKMNVTAPVVQLNTVNGVSAPKVVRTAYANIELTFDDTSTEEERQNMASYIAWAFTNGDELPRQMIQRLQGIY